MSNPVLSSQLLKQLVNPMESYGPLAEECILEAAHKFAEAEEIEPTAESIRNTLKAMPNWKAQSLFEFHLCDVMGRKSIARLADGFKTQFEKTGIITLKEMDEACLRVDNLFSGNGKFSGTPNGKELLLPEILRQIEQVPIEQRSTSQLAASLTKSMFYGKSAATLLAESKTQTLAQLKLSLNIPMKSTAPMWGDNDRWDEPEEFDAQLPPPIQGPTPSIYPQLKAGAVPHLPSEKIYPRLDGNEMMMTPVVTDRGIGFHFRFSYLNFVFNELFNQGQSDSETWNSLPLIAQRDALRHCLYLQSCSGAAEELASSLFHTDEEFKMQLKFIDLTLPSFKNPELSAKFISEGEKLLELYYFTVYAGNSCLDFSAQFNTLQPEPLFLQYFNEMAIVAGIQYAENNWKRIDMIHLAMQALERCLHTKKG